jgi:hypothetical protein
LKENSDACWGCSNSFWVLKLISEDCPLLGPVAH